jgi:hypothetical protein
MRLFAVYLCLLTEQALSTPLIELADNSSCRFWVWPTCHTNGHVVGVRLMQGERVVCCRGV